MVDGPCAKRAIRTGSDDSRPRWKVKRARRKGRGGVRPAPPRPCRRPRSVIATGFGLLRPSAFGSVRAMGRAAGIRLSEADTPAAEGRPEGIRAAEYKGCSHRGQVAVGSLLAALSTPRWREMRWWGPKSSRAVPCVATNKIRRANRIIATCRRRQFGSPRAVHQGVHYQRRPDSGRPGQRPRHTLADHTTYTLIRG